MSLFYVVRTTKNADYDAPIALTNDTCFEEDTGFLEEEYIKRESCSHLLFN